MRPSSLFKNFLLFLGILTVFCAIYWPTLSTACPHHDDFRIWERMPKEFTHHPFYYIDFMLGRPLSAYLTLSLKWLVKTAGDLNIIRFLSILQLSLCATLCALFLRPYFPNRAVNFLIVISMTTLPGFEIMIAYAGLAYSVPALLLSLAAAWCASRIPPSRPFHKNFLHINAIRAVVLLFLALLTYPSTATFYWVVAVTIYLFSPPDQTDNAWQRILILVCIGVSTTALYGLYLKITKAVFIQYMGNSYNPYVLSPNGIAKIKWFVQEPLRNSLNLWNIFPKTKVAVATAVFITGTGLWAMRPIRNPSQGKRHLFKRALSSLVLLIILSILSFLPNLLSGTNAAYYRCTLSLTVIIFLLLIWALTQWVTLAPARLQRILITGVLICMAAYAVLQAHANIMAYRVIPSHAEFQYILDRIREADLSRYQRIQIVPVERLPNERYDEFVTPSTRYAQDANGIKNCALRELGLEDQPSVSGIDLRITRDPHTPPSTLVIDMGQLYKPSGKLAYLEKAL